MLSSSKYFLTDLEDTLSMVLKTSLKPLLVKYMMLSLKIAIVDSSFKYFIGVVRIAFCDQSYSIKVSVCSSIDIIGNFPVKSTYMVPYFGFSVAWYANRWLYLSVVIGRCRSLFVSSISNAVLISSLVLQIPCFFFLCRPCMLLVLSLGDIFGLHVL